MVGGRGVPGAGGQINPSPPTAPTKDSELLLLRLFMMAARELRCRLWVVMYTERMAKKKN